MKDELTVHLLEQHLGIPGKYGPWWTARRLLQECWKQKPDTIRDATFDLRDLPFSQAAYDILWRRPLEPHMLGWTVHHYDKNSQYLSACRSVKNGIGNPTHLDGDVMPGAPGIYRVTEVFTEMSTFDGLDFPPIIEDGQQWITNDLLLFARDCGYRFTVQEAWVFMDYTRILDKWAEKIWRARQALKEIYKPAYAAMKEIALVGNGAWATGKHVHEGIDLIHPNWWADVVGKARVNILANLLKYGSPVLIETDGLYFVKRDPNPRTAVPGILDRMGECGGYKHKASFTLTSEIYEQARPLSALDLAALFKKAGKTDE